MVSRQLYYTISGEELFVLGNKKCCIYTACGVSQTPIFHDKEEVKKEIDFGQYKFYTGGYYAKTPEHLTYSEAYTLWLVCAGRAEYGEKDYIEKLLKYGYIKNMNGVIEPNVVVFKSNADNAGKPYKVDPADRMTVLIGEIGILIKQVQSITRGYVVEQALKDGWLKYDENTINTIGAYIYL
ncbi:MAG: hypothetical protein K2K21_03755 [Lachnospiraceae bacterium]|nr:hypothetical protein [Lachnospiraceae bacterium]